MILIFLTGLVAMILMRTLRADYARYTARDEDDLEVLGPCLPGLSVDTSKCVRANGACGLVNLAWCRYVSVWHESMYTHAGQRGAKGNLML